jgi:hypothetical protein
LELYEAKNHNRSVNNTRFFGELFKLKMLSETIMHECIVRLLRSSSDGHSLEMCAVILTITGKDLDRPEAKVSECHSIVCYRYLLLTLGACMKVMEVILCVCYRTTSHIPVHVCLKIRHLTDRVLCRLLKLYVLREF